MSPFQSHRKLADSADSRRGVAERTLLIWFFVAVAFVMLVTGGVLVNRAVWGKRVDAKMAELTEAGFALTAEELQRRHDAAVPEENAAEIYQSAFQALDTGGVTDEEDLPYFGRANLPEAGDPLPPEMAEAVRTFLERNAEATGHFLAASRVADCAFPRRIDFEGLIADHVGRMREGARLLSLQVVHEANQGNSAAAAEAAGAVFRIGNHLRNEPFLIGALSRMAILGIGNSQVPRVLRTGGLSDEDLGALREAVSAAEDHFLLAPGLEAEIAFGIYSFQNLAGWFGPASDPLDYVKSGLWKFHGYALLGQTDRDLYHYLEGMEEMIAKARGPVAERLAPYAGGSWDLEDPTWSEFVKGRWMTDRMTISAGRMFEAEKKHLARVRAALVGVAASRYRLRHGEYPVDLSELTGNFLEAGQVVDPFTNAPLEYAVEEEGFTVGAKGEVLLRVKGQGAPDAKSPD